MILGHFECQYVKSEVLLRIVCNDGGNGATHGAEIIVVHAKGNVKRGFAVGAAWLGLKLYWHRIHGMAFRTCSTVTALTQSRRCGAVMTVLLAWSKGTHSGFFWRISAITGTCTALARCMTAVSTEMMRSHCARMTGNWKKFSSALNSSVRASSCVPSTARALASSCGTALTMKVVSLHCACRCRARISAATCSNVQQRFLVLAYGLMKTSLPLARG